MGFNSKMTERLLTKLMIHFFQGSLNFSIEHEELSIMTWALQEQFITKTIKSELNTKFPISNKFIKLFIKKILICLEPIQDIHDDFYTYLCNAINNEDSKDGFYYRHYLLYNDLTNIVTMKETNNMVVNGTTGMRTWEAALMLADWSLSNKLKLKGKRILELGSGIGFTGITIAKFCEPKSIWLTDCHIDVLRTICDNIEINFFNYKKEIKTENEIILYRNDQQSLGVVNLDWNETITIGNYEIPDIVIGADIVYDPSILQPLCNVLRAFSSKNSNLEIYICCVIRNENTTKMFLEYLHKNGFKFENLQTQSFHLEWNANIDTCFLRIFSHR